LQKFISHFKVAFGRVPGDIDSLEKSATIESQILLCAT